MPTKEELREVFRDTMRFFYEEPILSRAIIETDGRVKVYPENFSEEVDVHKSGNISVVQGRTLQTALKVHSESPDKKIAVLNFAASQHPGGGVDWGSRAQEESICRSSTLYPSLKYNETAQKDFYSYHEDGNFGWKATDRCIYSPDIVICKDDNDEIPERLTPDEFVKIDVVTCAAPHIFEGVRISDDALFALHVNRAKNILRIAAHNNVDVFIGGAFGCGAFHNPPEIVASTWKEALKVYNKKFDSIIFAVYCNNFESRNFKVFQHVLI